MGMSICACGEKTNSLISCNGCGEIICSECNTQNDGFCVQCADEEDLREDDKFA